jgi:hypothetical protein
MKMLILKEHYLFEVNPYSDYIQRNNVRKVNEENLIPIVCTKILNVFLSGHFYFLAYSQQEK